MTLRVKICGLTRAEDVACAVEAGADYVGFVLYEHSPRYVPVDRLAQLTAAVPQDVVKVGVAVNASADTLTEAVAAGGLDVIQFHGDETTDWLAGFRLTTAWKAVGLRCEQDVDAAAAVPVALLVVDAVDTAARGGTGKACDWRLAARLAQRRRILLAGGLRPENVAAAINRVQPWGVDVSSGVEAAPGIKDHDQIRRFVAAARDALETAAEP